MAWIRERTILQEDASGGRTIKVQLESDDGIQATKVFESEPITQSRALELLEEEKEKYENVDTSDLQEMKEVQETDNVMVIDKNPEPVLEEK